MARMLNSKPARKVIGGALAGAVSTILVWVLNTYVLSTPLPAEITAAVLTVITFIVSYYVPPSEDDQVVATTAPANGGPA